VAGADAGVASPDRRGRCRNVEAGQRRQRARGRRLGHGLRVVDEGLGRAGLEPEQPRQAGEKRGLLGAVAAIGLAHADRELEGELAQAGLAQLGHRRIQAQAPEQHVLVERDEVDLDVAAERFGHLAHVLALFGVLTAIGEGGHQGDGDEGTGLLGIHAGDSWGCVEHAQGRPAAPCSTAMICAQG